MQGGKAYGEEKSIRKGQNELFSVTNTKEGFIRLEIGLL